MDRRCLAAILLLLTIWDGIATGKTDPETGRCRVIWVGEISSYNEMVLDWILAEPRFELTIAVPCDIQMVGLKDAVRFARIYLPRTFDDLYGGNDVAIFHDFHPKVLP